MSEEPVLPRAVSVFISFVALLRANGFAVAPEQTTAFLAAIAIARAAQPRTHPPGRARDACAASGAARDL